MVHREQFSGSGDSCLDFIGDEQDVMFLAECLCFCEIPVGWHVNACFSLDGFHEESGHVGVIAQGIFERRDVVIWNGDEAFGIRPEIGSRAAVIRERNDGCGASVEVPLANDDLRLLRRDSFSFVCPFAANLDGGFDGFGAGIHRQHFFETKELGDKLLINTQLVVVKSTRSERKRFCLSHHGIDDARMAVALIHRRVGREEIVVPFAFQIPYIYAFAAREHDRQRVIIVCTVLIFKRHRFVRAHFFENSHKIWI